MNEKKGVTKAPKPEQRSVVDLKRIIGALEVAGCEVIEIKHDYSPTPLAVDTGYLAVVIKPCWS